MTEPENDILKQFGFPDDELLRNALSELDHLKVKSIKSKVEAWARFEKSVTSEAQVRLTPKVITFEKIWKIAASILLLLSLWMGFRTWNTTSKITSNNQVREIILPDNSRVTLNAASKISFNKFRWKSSRKVVLIGEALFKVNKGSSFEISTLGKTIRVLGTEFNVFSRDNYFEVKCISGKVEVQIPGSEQIFLTKGDAVKKEAGNNAPVKFKKTGNGATWINGEFYYHNADINLVLDEIARQFNVHISGEANNGRYSGYFNKTNLTKALNNVCLPMGMKYTISKDTITIRKGL